MQADHILDVLAELDEQRAAFGAAQHQYERRAPLAESALVTFEQRAKLALPDAFRTFVRTHWSSGAGPYYGLMDLPEPSDELAREFDPALADGVPLRGAIPLADQGCAMASVLVVTGARRGEVWFDGRDNGGGMALEAPSFDAWIDEWLDRALVEASLPIFAPHVATPGWEPHPLLDAAADAIERRTAPGRALTPGEARYPMDALPALAYLRVYQARFADALAIFQSIRDRKRDDYEAAFHLACGRVYRANGEPERWLDESRAGLAFEDAWFATRVGLLREASEAAFALGRTGDAIGFCEALATRSGNVQDHLMVAWHRVMTGDAKGAASWIIASANDGIGCDADAPLAERIDDLVNHGFLEALANSSPGGAKALAAALEATVARGSA